MNVLNPDPTSHLTQDLRPARGLVLADLVAADVAGSAVASVRGKAGVVVASVLR
ncbi:hypothetical protein RCO28_19720 [Streptomyces sp. LHD-70]|uniref:hypothetical protein n=1 Tax=Streptomyces sp. LHD-70 TaxID=3072140 RepID=UPI0028104161|nr:hypothetical protein [Streptomyces sp. LHD-70]MDQ8704703.1 hypothetical protein [Streptomyces sp. LHD-70]